MRRSTVGIGFIALAAVVLAAYYPSFTGWDQYENVHWISEILTPVTLAPTLDLAHWSLSLNALTGESDPAVYHVWNVAFHLLNGWMVYLLVYRLVHRQWLQTYRRRVFGLGIVSGAVLKQGRDDELAQRLKDEVPALVAAAVFLLHPIQTEAVAYLTGRWELVSTTLILVALVGPWHVATVAAVLAMTTKTSAIIVLPLILLVRQRGDDPVLIVPMLGALIVSGMAVYSDRFGNVPYLMQSHYGAVEYAARQAVAFWRMLALVVVPWGQTIDHDWGSVPALCVALAIPALLGSVVEIWRRRVSQPLLWLSACWILIAVAPRFFVRTPELMAEHHFYVPMVGVALLVGSWWTK